MKRVALLVAIGMLLVGTVLAGEREDSGGYRGPERTGIYPAVDLRETWPEGGPKLLWQYDGLGAGWSSITIHDGRAYVLGGTSPGHLHCFDVADGELIYRAAYGPDRKEGRFAGTRSTVEIAGDRAIFASGDGVIHCVRLEDGKSLWSVDTVKEFGNKVPGHGYNITPLIHEGKVICPIRRGRHTHVALDLETGETVWASAPSEYAIGDSSPVLIEAGGKELVADNLWHALVAIDPDTGKIVWKNEEGRTGTMMTPVWAESRLFADLNTHKAALFRPTDDPARPLEKVWQLQRGLNDISQALILDGKVFYLGTVVREVERTVERKDGTTETRKVRAKTMALHARDLDTGKELSTVPVRRDGSLIAADGHIYVLTGGEHNWNRPGGPDTWISLYKPTASGAELVSEFQPEGGKKEAWINPAIGAGRLFYRQGNTLSVYDLRPESYSE